MSKQGIAIYIRLSRADEDTGKEKDESDSIVNQRSLIHGFLDRNEELSGLTRMEFIDDGYSGTNADRPAFVEMMSKMKEGLFSVCVSKDFSRIFRDYIEMGECIERTFPLLHVRYISINDHYDSDEYKGTTGGMDVVMKNIIYGAYSRDLSVKVKSGKIQTARKGLRASGTPPYGYFADPDNKGMDIIDPESAKVVRRIFDEALSGYSLAEIARILNREGIESPSAYYKRKNPGIKKFSNIDSSLNWSNSMVRNIVDRFYYTGALVFGKSGNLCPCGKKREYNRNDLIIIRGMHDAIVTEDEFEKVQMMIHKKNPGKKLPKLYSLKSLVYCGCCGRAMSRMNRRSIKFVCGHRYDVDNSFCRGIVSPSEDVLEKIVYDAICKYSELAGIKINRIKKKAKKDNYGVHTAEETIQKLKHEIEKLKNEKLKSYERFAANEIGKDLFFEEKKIFDEKIADCQAQIEEEKLKIQILLSDEKGVYSEAEAVCKEYEGENHLSYEMAHAFVDKIIIHSEDRIEIVWRFKDFLEDDIRELKEKGLA